MYLDSISLKKLNSLKNNKKTLQDFFIKNNIRGTVIISPEGMNGTISGKSKDIIKSINKIKKLFKNSNFDSEKYFKK